MYAKEISKTVFKIGDFTVVSVGCCRPFWDVGSRSFCLGHLAKVPPLHRRNKSMDGGIRYSTLAGIGVLLIGGTTTILYDAKGYSNFEDSIVMEKGGQFVIGPISKQITAVLVLREYEKGNLSLNDEIGKYLPLLDQSWSKSVTVHHLLTRTHGIVDEAMPLEFDSGSQFQYSQLGYVLLARILENITGNSFKELSTQLFSEYGLYNTFHPDNMGYRFLVKGYEESENEGWNM